VIVNQKPVAVNEKGAENRPAQKKRTPPEGRVKAAKHQERVEQKSVGLQVALAKGNVPGTGGRNLATYAEGNLLNLATGGKKASRLLFNGHAGKVISRSQGRFGFTVLGSSHSDP